MTVDMQAIPEPFRGFLAKNDKEITAASADASDAGAKSQEVQDMLFLAAILLLTED